jgi:hypothetical protein
VLNRNRTSPTYIHTPPPPKRAGWAKPAPHAAPIACPSFGWWVVHLTLLTLSHSHTPHTLTLPATLPACVPSSTTLRVSYNQIIHRLGGGDLVDDGPWIMDDEMALLHRPDAVLEQSAPPTKYLSMKVWRAMSGTCYMLYTTRPYIDGTYQMSRPPAIYIYTYRSTMYQDMYHTHLHTYIHNLWASRSPYKATLAPPPPPRRRFPTAKLATTALHRSPFLPHFSLFLSFASFPGIRYRPAGRCISTCATYGIYMCTVWSTISISSLSEHSEH